MRTDEDIKRDVENEIRWSPYIDSENIAVTVKNGTVELAGFVRRYSEIFDAEAAAKRVSGVVSLANDIEVRLPSVDERPDADIARDAVLAVEFQIPSASDQVKVRVRNGWVTLEGAVPWRYQKQTAETAVRGVKGVRQLTDLIQIKPLVAPAEVKRRIEDAYQRNAAIDATMIQVEAVGSEVTLKGSVRSWAERREAEDAAWLAPGVTDVRDQLTVRV